MSLMTSERVAPIGSQEPRVWWSAPSVTTAGPEAVALAELAGLSLLAWQRLVCEHGMAQRPDGGWASFEVLLLVSRQNGKGSVLEAVELYWLFMLGRNIYHTAHLMKTSRKAFKRLWSLIESTAVLHRRVREVRKTAEEITVELYSGAFVVFMARGARAGRGLDDCDLLVLDEALFLEERTVDAIVPTMSTRPNAQVWYASSAGVVGSAVLRKLRARAVKQELTFFEWSVVPPSKRQPIDPTDQGLWRQANPSLGALISLEYVRNEQRLLSDEGFARERLGVFDEDPAAAKVVISRSAWQACAGAVGPPDGPVAFAVAASWPDAEDFAVAVAGMRGGELVVQVCDYEPGSAWVVPRLVEVVGRYRPVAVVVDEGGPAGHLVEELRRAGVAVVTPSPRELAHASKDFREAVVGEVPFLRHFDQPQLNAAVAGAGRRPLVDAWYWQRRGEVDISPLEAVTLAAWAARRGGPEAPPPVAVGGGDVRVETADLATIGF
ncbi:MAG: hypothetical protein L0H84_08175 [Pseudonocardia sp.]|nr:hypothetical protein [Pseudonocardia sp.]